jgi:hypothetical protein
MMGGEEVTSRKRAGNEQKTSRKRAENEQKTSRKQEGVTSRRQRSAGQKMSARCLLLSKVWSLW